MSEVSAMNAGAFSSTDVPLTTTGMIDPVTGKTMPPAAVKQAQPGQSEQPPPAVGTLALHPNMMVPPSSAELTVQQRYNLVGIAHSGHPTVRGWAIDTLERASPGSPRTSP